MEGAADCLTDILETEAYFSERKRKVERFSIDRREELAIKQLIEYEQCGGDGQNSAYKNSSPMVRLYRVQNS